MSAAREPFGVWTTCDECGHDWWCIPVEWDYLDEATSYACSTGCDHDPDDWRDWWDES